MQIDLETTCDATGEWRLVGQFANVVMADDAARSLSKEYKSPFRVIDRRWPDDPCSPVIMMFVDGKDA